MIPEQLKKIHNIKEYRPKKAGWGYIYFIVRENKVIYVGQTITGIATRLSEFRKVKKIKYDKVYHIMCSIEDLTYLEKYYIEKFTPSYNIQLPKHFKKSSELCINCKTNPIFIKKRGLCQTCYQREYQRNYPHPKLNIKEKLTIRYGYELLSDFNLLMTNYSWKLSDIALKYDFSREYARQIYNKLFTIPYRELKKGLKTMPLNEIPYREIIINRP